VAPTQLVKLTLMLETRLEELTSCSPYRENIAIKKTPDDPEISVERDLAIWSLDTRFSQIRYVTAALDRIADGTYGCCDEEIGIKRLASLPDALFCITCQESAEHGESKEPRVWKELVGAVNVKEVRNDVRLLIDGDSKSLGDFRRRSGYPQI